MLKFRVRVREKAEKAREGSSSSSGASKAAFLVGGWVRVRVRAGGSSSSWGSSKAAYIGLHILVCAGASNLGSSHGRMGFKFELGNDMFWGGRGRGVAPVQIRVGVQAIQRMVIASSPECPSKCAWHLPR